jgi:drug/metabolite transporter superfamily protein YnfA
MHLVTGFSLLLVAALLEAAGDALVRLGVHASAGPHRALMLGAGGLVLFAYGYVVNTAPWSFGRLIGVYIVFFFLVAQAIAWVLFGQAPSRSVLLGGALILIGGAVISVDAN